MAPWQAVSALSLGSFSAPFDCVVAIWILAAYGWADGNSTRASAEEGSVPPVARRGLPGCKPLGTRLLDWPARLFRDPLGAVLQKEFHSLLRMPRFRVLFGMACVFSVVVFIPIHFHQAFHHGEEFIRRNFFRL